MRRSTLYVGRVPWGALLAIASLAVDCGGSSSGPSSPDACCATGGSSASRQGSTGSESVGSSRSESSSGVGSTRGTETTSNREHGSSALDASARDGGADAGKDADAESGALGPSDAGMPLNASWSWTPVPSTAPEFSTVGVTGIWFGGLSHGVLTVSDTDVGDVLGLTGPTAVIATPLVDGRGTNNSTGVTTPFVGLAATSAAIIALSQPNVFVAGTATGTDFTISAIALDTQGTDSVDTDVWFSPITASSDGGGAVTGWIAGYQDQGTLYFGETSSPTLASGTSWNDSDWAQGWEDDGCFALAGDDFDAATGFYATSDGNTLYAFASDPTQALCVSVNGGATWTPVALETGAGVSAFGFHEGGAGVVAGGGGPGIDSGSTPPIAYFTTSGGTTESGWTASSLPTFGGVGQDQTALTFTNVSSPTPTTSGSSAATSLREKTQARPPRSSSPAPTAAERSPTRARRSTQRLRPNSPSRRPAALREATT